MGPEYFTTSEAAKVLSVSADTVLKWVKAGKIPSYRTPGGHARIPKDAVEKLLPQRSTSPEKSDPSKETGRFMDRSNHKYCWDFHAEAGVLKEDCLQCLAYKCRAQRCYEMRLLPEASGFLRIHCQTDCDACEYFKMKQEQVMSALILLKDDRLKTSLQREAEDSALLFQFASSEYECSAVVERFRPDYIVVDCAFDLSRTQAICRHLNQDARIPNARIILSSKKAKADDYCDNEAFAWITKPFTIQQLEDLIHGVMN